MIKLFLIPLSLIFVLAGSVNDGATGYVLSLPFSAIILYYISKSPEKWIKYSLLATLALATLIYYTQSKNSILYPQLGNELVLHKDIQIFTFARKSCTYFQPTYLNEEFLEDNPLNEEFFTADCIPEVKILSKGSKFTAVEVTTAHPDFGKNYFVRFSNKEDSFYLEEEYFSEVAENSDNWHYLKVNPINKLSYLLYYPLFILKIKDWLTN